MASCKHGPERITVAWGDDFIEVDSYIEFQSTSDVCHYYEMVTKEDWRKTVRKGDIVNELFFNSDTASQLRRFLNHLQTYRAEIKE